MIPDYTNPDESAQDQWIDSLLRSEVAKEIESPPSALVRSIPALARRRRRRRVLACGLAAAAALIVAVGWIVPLSRQAEVGNGKHSRAVVADNSHAEPSPNPSLQGRGNMAAVAATENPRAKFIGGPEFIIVPLESRHANVSIVRVYRTYEPLVVAKDAAEEPAPADDIDVLNPLNGG